MSSDAEVLEQLFQDEVARQMTIVHGYLAVEREPSMPLPGRSFSQAYQAVKGAARVVEFAEIARLAGELEAFFAATEAAGEGLSEDALVAVERANALLEQVAEGPRASAEARVAEAAGELEAIRATLAREAPVQGAKRRPEQSPRPSADATMDQLFRLEAEAHSAALADGLLALEREPDRLDVLDRLMREAHSLKGAARVVGLDACVKLTHAMEDLFVRARTGALQVDGERVELCLAATDLVMRVAQGGSARPDDDELLALAARLGGSAGTEARRGGASAAGGGPEPPRAASEASGEELEPPRAASEASAGGREPGRGGFGRDGEEGAVLARAASEASAGGLEPSRGTTAASGEGAGAPGAGVAAPAGRARGRAKEVVGGGAIGNEAGIAGTRPTAVASAAAGGGAVAVTAASGGEARVDESDRVLRVRASHLSRLVGLSGELLVESRRLGPLADTQQRLRSRHAMLSDLLNDLHQMLGAPAADHPVGEHIAALRARISECRELAGAWGTEFAEHARRSEDLTLRLFREASAGRMRPIADGLAAFPRMVRDLARRLGKRVDLVIRGDDTAIDRDILEKIEAPLNHIVRNCVDHGIEPPDERAAQGKPARGQVKIEVSTHSGVIEIRLSDDGRGLDPDAIRQRVSTLGLLPAEKASALDEESVFDYIFSPGFSTAAVVTEVSGRGVGLDVVQSVLHEVGGSVHVRSERGRGASFELRVPVSRSVIRAVVVLIAGEPYAFPLNQIDRLLVVPFVEVQLVEDRQYIVVDNRSVALVPAGQILELDGSAPVSEQVSAVMLSDRTHRFAFAVDRFVGEFDLVVRPLDARLGRVTDISAAAILPDGAPVLILDTEDLVRSVLRLQQVTRFAKLASGSVAARKVKRVLVVDDSITVRELQRQLLSAQGYDVHAAVDGADGFRAVRDEPFDLVLTDVDMPRMDGIALTRSIKQDARLRSIPVVLMSYRDSPADRIRGLDAAADYFLGKSEFTEDALLRVVMDLIGPP